MGQRSCHMVNGQRLVDILGFRRGISPLRRLKRGLDQFGNAAEADPAGDKGRHGDFVGRIEDGRSSSAGFERAAAERQRREAVRVRRLEGQRADLGKIELGRGTVDSDSAKRGNGRSECACRVSRAAPPPSRRGIRPCRG